MDDLKAGIFQNLPHGGAAGVDPLPTGSFVADGNDGCCICSSHDEPPNPFYTNVTYYNGFFFTL